MNRVGKYAAGESVDEIELMNMVFELSEKDKMLMWSEGYFDLVIEKLPVYARDILLTRKEKWEDTEAYIKEQLQEMMKDQDLQEKIKGERKGFALFVMDRYPKFQSLLFAIYDGKLREDDIRKFVYRWKYPARKRYLR